MEMIVALRWDKSASDDLMEWLFNSTLNHENQNAEAVSVRVYICASSRYKDTQIVRMRLWPRSSSSDVRSVRADQWKEYHNKRSRITVMNACDASDPRNNQDTGSEVLGRSISTISERTELWIRDDWIRIQCRVHHQTLMRVSSQLIVIECNCFTTLCRQSPARNVLDWPDDDFSSFFVSSVTRTSLWSPPAKSLSPLSLSSISGSCRWDFQLDLPLYINWTSRYHSIISNSRSDVSSTSSCLSSALTVDFCSMSKLLCQATSHTIFMKSLQESLLVMQVSLCVFDAYSWRIRSLHYVIQLARKIIRS